MRHGRLRQNAAAGAGGAFSGCHLVIVRVRLYNTQLALSQRVRPRRRAERRKTSFFFTVGAMQVRGPRTSRPVVPRDNRFMVNRNLLAQFELPEEELQQELQAVFAEPESGGSL